MKNDEQLKADVELELRWEPSVHAERIGVSAKGGVVQLDGQVDSYYEKWAAERAALRVSNVKAVACEIKVVPPASETRTDEDIARTVSDHLQWNYAVPDAVKAQVSDGWITLTGNVEWEYQKEEAERAVRYLKGVKGVFNDINVNPTVTAMGVKNKIVEALKRNAQVDANRINVDVDGSEVFLSGSVRSWAEREEAEHTAWAAPGVTKVEDQLAIKF
jgi:osmotically-inducible protein OsmY